MELYYVDINYYNPFDDHNDIWSSVVTSIDQGKKQIHDFIVNDKWFGDEVFLAEIWATEIVNETLTRTHVVYTEQLESEEDIDE